MKRLITSLHIAGLALILPVQSFGQDAVTAAVPEEKAAQRKPITLKGGPGYSIRYLADLRADTGWKTQDNGLMAMAAEAEVTGNSGEHWDWAVQVPFFSEMKGRGRDMHFGNAYAIYRGKLGEPTFKFGQFVVPFGTLSTYETHTQIVQTLYANSIGVRIDPGVEVEGYLRQGYPYQLSFTTGNGSFRGIHDSSRLVTGRVSHTFELGDNELRLGISLAHGRLPTFSTMGDPLMGRSEMIGFQWKTLGAIDGEFYWGPYLLRGEIVGGSIGGRNAYGHWLQASYPLTSKTSVEAGVQRWSQYSGGMTGYWGGLEHKLTATRTIRFAVQHMRMSEAATSGMGPSRMTETMVTGQLYLQY